MCKILVVIIINRIKLWYEAELQDQQGFNKDSEEDVVQPTTDGMYHLKIIHQITAIMKNPAYLAFIDLTAAFDHVIRPWLFQSIQHRISREENGKLFQLIKSFYSYTKTAMADSPHEIFELITGVRCLSPV